MHVEMTVVTVLVELALQVQIVLMEYVVHQSVIMNADLTVVVNFAELAHQDKLAMVLESV
jgi:hypothetical protein